MNQSHGHNRWNTHAHTNTRCPFMNISVRNSQQTLDGWLVWNLCSRASNHTSSISSARSGEHQLPTIASCATGTEREARGAASYAESAAAPGSRAAAGQCLTLRSSAGLAGKLGKTPRHRRAPAGPAIREGTRRPAEGTRPRQAEEPNNTWASRAQLRSDVGRLVEEQEPSVVHSRPRRSALRPERVAAEAIPHGSQMRHCAPRRVFQEPCRAPAPRTASAAAAEEPLARQNLRAQS